jgi:CDP-diacylglycerol--glycerol-3-phosphate 3-phosphatidyltransferase
MKHLPFGLILFRLFLSPCMIYLAWKYGTESGNLLAILLIAGILSDVFDGVIARKLNLSTDKLRKWDSNVDLIFLLGILVCAFLLYPMAIEFELDKIVPLIMMEFLMYIICFIRFKKSPANHAYSSKFFAMIICVALCYLFVNGTWGIWLSVLFFVGTISYLDNFLILLLLPTYRVDTKSFLLAWKIRRAKN